MTKRVDQAQAYMQQHGIRGQDTTAVVVAAALERGIKVTATKRRRRALLEHDGRRFYFLNGNTDLNDRLAKRCCGLKEVTSRLLRSRGIPSPENAVFGPDDTRRAWAWAKPLRPVVVKPHNQNQGQGVHVGLTDRRAFSRAFDEVAHAYGSVLVEQFATGTEHRVLVVDGRVVAATLRVPANVEGDGRSTVEQLVEQKNAERKTERGRVHKPLQLDGLAVAQLRRQKLHPGSVPGDGQRVYLRATSNIHTGGDAHDATDDLAPDEVALVERAAAAIPGLGLGGFDVLLPRQPGETDISILEVNPSPMVSMHHFPWVGQPRDAAGAILDTMFPATRPSPPAVDPIADQLDHDDRGDELCSSCGQANEIVFGSLDCVDCVEAGLVTQST